MRLNNHHRFTSSSFKSNVSLRGYGGKFGVESDRMDGSAVGHEYRGSTEKHSSQKDYATGFGGKFGLQKDRVDKVRLPQ